MRNKITIGLSILLISACAERPVKIVIDPPAGASPQSKITYETEDRVSGKNEKVTIPVPQLPQKLIIDQPVSRAGEPIASATLADNKFISDDEKSGPSVSYLKGSESVEKLYRTGKYQDALIQIAPLIEGYPKQSKLYVMQGTIYRKLGEKKMAYKSYEKALELDKDNLKVQEALDTLSAQSGEVR